MSRKPPPAPSTRPGETSQATFEARLKALGPEHPETLAAAEAEARALDMQGDASRAEDLLRRALRGLGRGPLQPSAPPLTRLLAEIVEQQGRAIDADTIWRELVKACEASLGAGHRESLTSRVGFSEMLRRTGRSLQSLEILRGAPQQLADAVTSRAARLASGRSLIELERFPEAEAVQRAVIAELSGRPEETDALAAAEDLATVLTLLGRAAEGVSAVEALADERVRTLGAADERTLEASVAAVALRVTSLPDTVPEEALAALTARCEEALGQTHRLTVLARVHRARLALARGARDAMRSLLSAVLEAVEGTLGPSHADVLLLRADVATQLLTADAAEEAEALLARNLALRRGRFGRDHRSVLADEALRIVALAKLGRAKEAEAAAALLLRTRERRAGPDHHETVEVMDMLASVRESLGRGLDALPLRERSYAAQQRLTGPHHPLTLDRQLSLAFAFEGQHRLDKARPLFLAVLDGHRRRGEAGEADLCQHLQNLAPIFVFRLHDPATSEQLCLEAVALLTRRLGAEHPETLAAVKALDELRALPKDDLAELLVPHDPIHPVFGRPVLPM